MGEEEAEPKTLREGVGVLCSEATKMVELGDEEGSLVMVGAGESVPPSAEPVTETEEEEEGDPLPLSDAEALRVALLVAVAVPEAV